MELKCQQNTLAVLKELASQSYHSVLIDGCSGCGKTYLAYQYAKFLGISDFHIVQPTVQEVRSSIDTCSSLSSSVVICIENLDTGVLGAAYTLLKFLEEPKSNVFIVVTCRNLQRVPDTILSRSICVSASPPIVSDLRNYAESVDAINYQRRKDSIVWFCVKTLSEVNSCLSMTDEQFNYLNDLRNKLSFREPVSSLSWTLSKFPDGSDVPVEMAIRVVMEIYRNNTYIQKCGVECIYDISSGRISVNAAVSKFLIECKYGG